MSEKELTPLEKAHQVMRERRESGEEIQRLSPIEKAKRNPKSLRAAVNGKCWECSNEQRQEIKHCPMTDCSLWNVRPYQ